jgi:hypothetical protein
LITFPEGITPERPNFTYILASDKSGNRLVRFNENAAYSVENSFPADLLRETTSFTKID